MTQALAVIIGIIDAVLLWSAYTRAVSWYRYQCALRKPTTTADEVVRSINEGGKDYTQKIKMAHQAELAELEESLRRHHGQARPTAS